MKDLENRDRAKAEFCLDADLESVLEFMQKNVPVGKIVGIAEAVPVLARILWGHQQWETHALATLLPPLPRPSTPDERQLVATE